MINKLEVMDACRGDPPGSACFLPGSQGGTFLLCWTQAFHSRAPSPSDAGLPSTEGLVFRLVMSSQIRLTNMPLWYINI